MSGIKQTTGTRGSRPGARRQIRAGVGIVELLVALILIGALTATVLPALGKIETIRIRAERQQYLSHVAANVVEMMHAPPRRTQRDLDELTRHARLLVNDESLEVELHELPESLQGADIRFRTLRVTVREKQGGETEPAVQLTTWLPLSEGEVP